MQFLFLLLLQLSIFVFTKDLSKNVNSGRFPIVFVYTVVANVCQKGLPQYIKESLQQAIITQPDCDVIMASNFADCALLEKDLLHLPELIKFDTRYYAISENLNKILEDYFRTEKLGETTISASPVSNSVISSCN
jgi:hypothetical protein